MPMDHLLLVPKEASAYLKNQRGLRVSHTTLAKYRSIGDGPEYVQFGRAIYYCPGDLDKWALWRLSKKRHTSELSRTPANEDADIFTSLRIPPFRGKAGEIGST